MIDRIDKQILEILQTDSQISNQDLADKVALSPSPCLRRVKQLEKDGYIKKHVALLDPKLLGLKLTVFALVGVKSHSPEIMDGFAKAIELVPEVIECHIITGQSADFILKIMVPDMDYYNKFLFKKLLTIDGIANVTSSFVLNSPEDKTALPLGHL